MNLAKLFEMQRQLDERIEQKHPRQEGEDRLAKKILALMVELGELANEWRGFKFWSNDQNPRTTKIVRCHACGGQGFFLGFENSQEDCMYCEGTGIQEEINPLLEEYVDCLHFILSIGLELGMPHRLLLGNVQENEILEDDFITLYAEINALYDVYKHQVDKRTVKVCYESVFEHFLTLGEKLGFTWEQVEQAYMQKHAENIARQERGY